MLVYDLADPRRLVGEARGTIAALDQTRYVLSRFLPRQVDRTIRFEITRGGDPLVEAATYRGFDVESAIGRRRGITRATGRILPISRKIPLTESEQYQLDGITDPRILAHYNDARLMAAAVAARLELARGEVLSTGVLNIAERGAVATITFGVPAEHLVAAAVPWTDLAGSDPFADLALWLQVWIDSNNGARPGALVMATRLVGLMARSESVLALLDRRGAGPGYVTSGQLRGMLQDFDLPPIIPYDVQVTGDDGTTSRVIPDNVVLMLPAPGPEEVPVGEAGVERAGETLFGVTLEARDLSQRQVLQPSEVPGVAAVMHSTSSPITRWTEAVALAVPLLRQPQRVLAATVAA